MRNANIEIVKKESFSEICKSIKITSIVHSNGGEYMPKFDSIFSVKNATYAFDKSTGHLRLIRFVKNTKTHELHLGSASAGNICIENSTSQGAYAKFKTLSQFIRFVILLRSVYLSFQTNDKNKSFTSGNVMTSAEIDSYIRANIFRTNQEIIIVTPPKKPILDLEM